MVRKCPHCGKKVGREAQKCWNCKEDLKVYVPNRGRTQYKRSSGLGLEHAALFMVISGILYYISSLISLFYYTGNQICLGDIIIILTFIGALLTIARISYIGSSICCLLPGIIIAFRAAGLSILIIVSLICILLAAHLIYKNKDEFV